MTARLRQLAHRDRLIALDNFAIARDVVRPNGDASIVSQIERVTRFFAFFSKLMSASVSR